MLAPYLRSSSINCHRNCPQEYFIEYNLGWKGKPNKAAIKGTITHKLFEILSIGKKVQQNNKKTFEHEILGKLNIQKLFQSDLLKETHKVYNYYIGYNDHVIWTSQDRQDVYKWVWKLLEYNNGNFDPRQLNIVEPEAHFDIEIKEPWAFYDYKIKDQTYSEYLRLKGTIDLITSLEDGVYEVIDLKTGRYRTDWATGEEKTYTKLHDDIQLRMYHLACSYLYPNIHTFLITIIYINAGGAFSLAFDNEDLDKTKQMIKKRFQQINATTRPQLNKSWKCRKLCSCGTNTFNSPMIETREKQFTNVGEPMTRCQEIDFQLNTQGYQWVLDHYMQDNFNPFSYNAPGEV